MKKNTTWLIIGAIVIYFAFFRQSDFKWVEEETGELPD